ncbi:MAG: hypothetical protein ACRDJG_09170 [Actinomycetota bacterium]
MKHRSWVCDGLFAGAVGGLVAGIPSTLHGALTGGGILTATRAAGALILPKSRSKALLSVAGAAAHSVISLGWGVAMAGGLRTGAGPMTGAAAGLAIAALDLGVVGRRIPAIRRLPVVPQILDHLVYGAAVGAALRSRGVPARPEPG